MKKFLEKKGQAYAILAAVFFGGVILIVLLCMFSPSFNETFFQILSTIRGS